MRGVCDKTQRPALRNVLHVYYHRLTARACSGALGGVRGAGRERPGVHNQRPAPRGGSFQLLADPAHELQVGCRERREWLMHQQFAAGAVATVQARSAMRRSGGGAKPRTTIGLSTGLTHPRARARQAGGDAEPRNCDGVFRVLGLSTGLTHPRARARQAGRDAEPGRERAARGRALGLARRRRHAQPLLRAGAHPGRTGCQVP